MEARAGQLLIVKYPSFLGITVVTGSTLGLWTLWAPRTESSVDLVPQLSAGVSVGVLGSGIGSEGLSASDHSYQFLSSCYLPSLIFP